jgi:two-component system response regulator GlrR
MRPVLLVVDENRNIRDFCARELGRNGYRVLTARSCREARGVLGTEKVNVVVTDFGRSPRQFAALVTDAAARGARLIVHTADMHAALEMLAPGVIAWVEKTGNLAPLARTIACTLRRNAAPPTSAAVS